jgi:hypothetical protein
VITTKISIYHRKNPENPIKIHRSPVLQVLILMRHQEAHRMHDRFKVKHTRIRKENFERSRPAFLQCTNTALVA